MVNKIKVKTNKALQKALEHSSALKMLIPIYQQALHNLATSGNPALQRTLAMIVKREKSGELQSMYFVERLLREFVTVNFPMLSRKKVLRQYRDLAIHLIQTFLFFRDEDIKPILPKVKKLELPALLKLIQLYRDGHRKQLEYLQIIAEKDPKLGTQFRLLVEQATNPKH